MRGFRAGTPWFGRPVRGALVLCVLVLAGLAACGAGSASPGLPTPEEQGPPLTASPALSPSATETPPSAGRASPGGASTAPSRSPASTAPVPGPTAAPPFALTSTAFADGGSIPRAYTCDGRDISPALAWSGAPVGTTALALLVTDPDAGGFVHWVAFDIPGAADGSLPAAIPASAASPRQGTNDFGKRGWGGPCPPSGEHRYRFTLFALDTPLGLSGAPTGRQLTAALASAKVLDTVALEGRYRRR